MHCSGMVLTGVALCGVTHSRICGLSFFALTFLVLLLCANRNDSFREKIPVMSERPRKVCELLFSLQLIPKLINTTTASHN